MSDETKQPQGDQDLDDVTDHQIQNQSGISPPKESSTLCQICKQHPSKYCCPRCNIKTCSASCIQRHKEDMHCNGKRDRTSFIGRGDFDDTTFFSDYKFLEEVKLAGDVAKRAKPPTPKQELPRHLQTLVYQAKQRDIDLKILAPGMEKRKSNTTRYDYKKQTFNWKVEWEFVAAGCKAGSPRVNEAMLLIDALQETLTPAPGSSLKTEDLLKYARCDVDQLVLLMKKEKTPANAPLYHRLDGKKTVRDMLKGKVIVEYPVVLVLLPEEENLVAARQQDGNEVKYVVEEDE